MTLDAVILALGAFVALLPFLQLPQDWTAFLTCIAGIGVIVLGVAVRRRIAHIPQMQSPRASAPDSYGEVKDAENHETPELE